MKKLKLLAFVFVGLSIAMVSCSKKGDTGPAGATGATGPAGPAGADGSDNVLHSAWITLNTPFVTADSLYEQTITAAGLTGDILSNGVVESYIGFPNGGDTVVFNIYDPLLQGEFGLVSQTLFTGEIDLACTGDYTGALYRYVLIPSTAITNSVLKNYTKDQLKAIDYSTLTKALNITSAKASNN